MSSSHTGSNPKAPAFISLVSDDWEDELSAPAALPKFTTGGSGVSTPIPRSATPKRPRADSSPPPPVIPIDWAKEFTKFMTATGDGRKSQSYKLTAFGTMLGKLEERQQDTINTLKETVSYLLGEITTLTSEVATLDNAVDTVITSPPAFVPAPATPTSTLAPPAPKPPPPPPTPPAAAAPSWAAVTKRVKKKKAVPPPVMMTAVGPVDSFHHKRAPVETYPQYLARM